MYNISGRLSRLAVASSPGKTAATTKAAKAP